MHIYTQEKSHFENMRCAYRPVLQHSNNNGHYENGHKQQCKWHDLPNSKVVYEQISRREVERKTPKMERSKIKNFNHGFISIVFIDLCSR